MKYSGEEKKIGGLIGALMAILVLVISFMAYGIGIFPALFIAYMALAWLDISNPFHLLLFSILLVVEYLVLLFSLIFSTAFFINVFNLKYREEFTEKLSMTKWLSNSLRTSPFITRHTNS